MKIKGEKKGYIIHKVTEDNYLVCKILKDYDNIDDAKDGLVKLLTGKVKEKDLKVK